MEQEKINKDNAYHIKVKNNNNIYYMKIEIIILLATSFIIYNTYHDGKILTYIKSNKKYIEMGVYAFIGLCLYLLFKKKPNKGKEFLKQANGMIKYMPIDREALSLLNPLIDMTSRTNDNFDIYGINQDTNNGETRIRQSGNGNTNISKATKRSVGETKKKWVASQQNWNCKHCQKQLNAWFEVDHVIKLEHGGSNNVDNLVALCRECHGEKTAKERL